MALNNGYKPKIMNSDQGCQFTSQEWVYALSLLQIKVSMDGKGRCLDNIPIERFWRSIKYEEVYLKTYDNVRDAKKRISKYIQWYNYERRHTGINKHRPYEVMTGKEKAFKWAFFKADGYVDNYKKLPHIPTASTTRTKSQINMKKKVNLSSEIAA